MIITGGIHKGRRIIAPDENITRPTLSKVRMGVFNTLYSLIGDFEGKSFLDVFGGSGIMGIEAVSRRFSSVTVCEKNPKAVQIIKKNYSSLGIKPDLYSGDCRKFLKSMDNIYDIAYVDPPYSSGIYEEIFTLLDGKARIIIAECSDDVSCNKFNLLKSKNYGGKKVLFFVSDL